MAGVAAGHSSRSCYFFALALGCSSITSGTARPLPTGLAPMTASGGWERVTTRERNGLLILWNAQTMGRSEDEQGWLANDQAELAELWRGTKALAHAPTVDFGRYIVMGLSFHGWPCRREISGAFVDTRGTIVLQTGNEQITCIDVRVPLALVIALPRRLLHDRGRLVAPDLHHAFEFSIPDPVVGEPTSASAQTADQGANDSIANDSMEVVPLPPPGHLRLATLRDHNQVWVSHEIDGAINVFTAEAPLALWPSERSFTNLSIVVTWYPAWGRFVGGWDTQGRSVNGFPSLAPRRWSLTARGELMVGAITEAKPGPIRPPSSAPQLDGPENAWSTYASLPLSSWQSLHDGEVGLVDLDLVASRANGAQLCRVPKRTETAARFNGCPHDAPHVWGEASQHLSPTMFGIDGPLVVRRHGALAEVIVNRTPTPKLLRGP